MKKTFIRDNNSVLNISSCSSMSATPNLNGDWKNFYLLLLLYTIQGLPLGISTALPIIFQSKMDLSFKDQALFSLVLWPYSMKLFWAPFVDSIYIRSIGKRKSWLISIQYLLGIFFLYIASNIEDWLPESKKPKLKTLVYVFFAINFLSAIQDIVVDGWALTMLKKNNVSYASTCNGTGVALGMFIGSVFPIILTSEEFCNKYLRITPNAGGIITIKSFFYFWGIVFIMITTLVGIFKREKDHQLEDGYIKINILQNYKLIWDILKLPNVIVLSIALLTGRFGFVAMEAVSNLKLIDAGVSENSIILLSMVISISKIVMPLLVTKYTTSPKPMSLFLKMTPIRILWNITYGVLFYYTPVLLKSNAIIDKTVYFIILGFIWFINEAILYYVMLIAVYAFFSRISDPRFGGTYMTLLNTVDTLGWSISNTLALKLVDVFTFYKCSNDEQNSCSTSNLKNVCKVSGGTCVVFLDGYYVEIGFCIISGFIWYCIFKNVIKNLQSKNLSVWLVNMKPQNVQYVENSFVITSA